MGEKKPGFVRAFLIHSAEGDLHIVRRILRRGGAGF